MTMMTDPIRILMASDLHFGIPSINQEDMANAFVRTVFPLLEDTDIFFINGDFFDTLVSFDNYGFDPIYDTILNLFAYCEKYKVTLRILQGTWTHDRNQCQRFEPFYRHSRYTFDFRFMDGIQLEELYVRDRELRILYVQDDLPYKSSDEIVDVIQAKMTDIGWDHVDYGCMHGFFDFTFPSGVSQDNVVVYKESQFPFVRKVIDVGHVHQHRIRGNVISNGSFDRAGFGDEDPKGLIRIFDYPDHYTAQFIENKSAAVYDTLVITSDDTTESITKRVTDHVSKLVTDRKISLRFIVDLPEHREAIKVWMKEVYPDIRFGFKKKADSEVKPTVLASSELFIPVERRIAPTPATIATFVRTHMPDNYELSIDAIEQYLLPVSK